MNFYRLSESLFKYGNDLFAGIVETQRVVADFGIVKKVSYTSRIPSADIVRRDIVPSLQNSLLNPHGGKFGARNIQVEQNDAPPGLAPFRDLRQIGTTGESSLKRKVASQSDLLL